MEPNEVISNMIESLSNRCGMRRVGRTLFLTRHCIWHFNNLCSGFLNQLSVTESSLLPTRLIGKKYVVCGEPSLLKTKLLDIPGFAIKGLHEHVLANYPLAEGDIVPCEEVMDVFSEKTMSTEGINVFNYDKPFGVATVTLGDHEIMITKHAAIRYCQHRHMFPDYDLSRVFRRKKVLAELCYRLLKSKPMIRKNEHEVILKHNGEQALYRMKKGWIFYLKYYRYNDGLYLSTCVYKGSALTRTYRFDKSEKKLR